MSLNFNIERSGFPIQINGLEFFLDTADENLRKLGEAEKALSPRLLELQKELESIDLDSGNLSENVNKALDIRGESAKLQYDLLLGEGAYDKIYEIIPDVSQLELLLDKIGEAIAEEQDKALRKRNADRLKKIAKYKKMPKGKK